MKYTLFRRGTAWSLIAALLLSLWVVFPERAGAASLKSLGELAVGSTVKLNVDGTAKTFRIIQQGSPSTDVYGNASDGTWVLGPAATITELERNTQYPNSFKHSYLSNTYFQMLDDGIKNSIRQIDLPYNGDLKTSAKIFVLSSTELGDKNKGYYLATAGIMLSYFSPGQSDSAFWFPEPCNSRLLSDYGGGWTRDIYRNGDGCYITRLTSDDEYATTKRVPTSGSATVYPTMVLDPNLLIDSDGTVITETDYTVRYYQQSTTGTGYTLKEQLTEQAAIGSAVTAEEKSYAGFHEDTSRGTVSGTVASDGSTVLSRYYDRNTNTVSYAYTGAATDVTPPALPAAATYRYGQSVTLAIAPALPGYDFSGWSLSPTLLLSGGAFAMPDGPVAVTGSWTPRSDTPYTVEYYQQHTDDDGYDLADTEHCTGTTGAAAAVPDKMYPGFFETAESIADRSGAVIKSDGSTVIKLYYDRSTNTVSYVYTGAATDVTPPALPAAATYRYGQSVALASIPALPGYDFSGWSLSPTLLLSGGAFVMPGTAVSVTGSWIPRTDTPYTVEYYQQHTDDDGYELADTEHCTGTTGAAATVPDKMYPGFFETAESVTGRSGAVIRSDGSTVIKLHFDRNTNTVSYAYTGATTDVTPPVLPTAAAYRFGQSVTLASVPVLPGYDFSGWSLSPALTISGGAFVMPDGPVIVTGSWIPRPDTPYTVEYYQQHTDDDGYDLADTEHCIGTTGVAATAPDKTYPGFFENTESITGRSGVVIRSDGSTVIKLYFDRTTNTVSYAYTGAATDVTPPALPAAATYRYGQSVTLASIPALSGFDFSGWHLTPELEVSNGAFVMPDEPVSVTGSWTPRADTPYTVEYYQQHTDDDGYELAYTFHGVGVTGAGIPHKEFEGFVETPDSVTTEGNAVIRSDGSTVVKLYYDRERCEVTYAYLGTVPQGAAALPAATTYRYGQSVTLASVPALPGYDFSGWQLTPKLEISNGTFVMPGTAVSITGSWTPRADTPYTVEYYQQHTDDDGYDLAYIFRGTGVTGAGIPHKEFEGFIETPDSVAVEGNAVIRSDGSTVVKLYYDRERCEVTYAYLGTVPQGAAALPAATTYRYGQSVTLASVPALPGYDFSGWRLDPAQNISNGAFLMPSTAVSVTGSWSMSGGDDDNVPAVDPDEQLQSLEDNGSAYIIGYDDGSFRPNDYLTARHEALMLSRLGLTAGLTGAERERYICSPLTGVTTNSGDPPTGYRVYDACRGSSVFRGCRLSMS